MKPPRSRRVIAALDSLQEIFQDKSEDGTIRVMAAGLLAQICNCPIDLSVGTPMHWKEAMLRIRTRTKPQKDKAKRKSRNVSRALQTIRQLENEE